MEVCFDLFFLFFFFWILVLILICINILVIVIVVVLLLLSTVIMASGLGSRGYVQDRVSGSGDWG